MADGMMFEDRLAHLDRPLPLLNYNAPRTAGVSKIIDTPKCKKKSKKKRRTRDQVPCGSLMCALREAGII